jgi:prophage antirepressor-like protein
MTEIKIFENTEFGEIRVIEHEGEPWFVGKDVASALGYKNPRQAIATNVDDEDRGVHLIDTPSGVQEMTIINESGLYSLILSSKLQGAKKFKHWVTSEVLPTIRKTGSYSAQQPTEYQKTMLSVQDKTARIQAATLLNQIASEYDGPHRQILQAYATKELSGKFLLPLPKSERPTYTAQEIGKQLGISANKVGHLANKHGLKTEKYGAWFLDKSPYSSKEVRSFRYYDDVIEELRNLLGT